MINPSSFINLSIFVSETVLCFSNVRKYSEGFISHSAHYCPCSYLYPF